MLGVSAAGAIMTVPDNAFVRWSPDYRWIYAGGQAVTTLQLLKCFASASPNCSDVPFQIDRVDPRTLALSVLKPAGVLPSFGAGTGAIKVGQSYWNSTVHADRLAIIPAH